MSIYQHLIKMPIEQLLQDVINYLERTKDEDWCVDRVRTSNHKQNCFMGHLYNFGGQLLCDVFENSITNEFIYFPINDGKNPNYPQETPKKRIIAYLENLKNEKEITIENYLKTNCP